jgi:hypothetical protein
MINFIIYNPKTNLFDFFIESLKIELKKYDEFLIIQQYSETSNDSSNSVIFILINPHFIYDYKEIQEDIKNINKKYKYKILYITEPINFIVEKKVYTELINLIKPYCLWTYTNYNFNKINTYLKMFKIFPNYNSAYYLTEISIDIIKKKKINHIFFIGNINENRRDTCNQFRDFIINKRDMWFIDDWKEILNNNLFYLNIHRRNNCKSFEAFRIIPLLANGVVIFSENCNKEEEEIYEKYNIIFCKKEELYSKFMCYKENIDYGDILKRAILFREDFIKDDLEKYILFHRNSKKIIF